MTRVSINSGSRFFRQIGRVVLRRKRKPKKIRKSTEWSRMVNALNDAASVVDLGCGANPHPKASVAVDAYIEPKERTLGAGPRIIESDFAERGVRFVQSDILSLPFEDNEFDFAYSHHVFEHLENPLQACREMQRVARAGVIITPSFFSEIAFGRPYHRWLVCSRGNRIVFIEKTGPEDRPFGEHPVPQPNGGYKVESDTNPFDILLNDQGWYRGREVMPRLASRLRELWYSHSVATETVFLWRHSFCCSVIDRDGHLRSDP